MASKDRTVEFFSLCQSLPPTPINSQSKPPPPPPSSKGRYSPTDANDELRTFHKTASMLSKDIYSTSTLLSELTTLIHSRSGSLFVDESTKVNSLVLRIKSNIESLNTKLDAANDMIQRNKRRLGRNSQAGLEASNLVGQLQEEFVNTTKGFKDVLQVRSDRIKERTDKESHLLGSASHGGDIGEAERISLLGNKPRVYEKSDTGKFGNTSAVNQKYNAETRLNSGGLNSFSAGGESGLSNGLSNGPRLDLTSAILQNNNRMQPGESTMQLPRPYGIQNGSETEQFPTSSGIRLRHGSSSMSSSDANLPSTSLPVYTPLDIQRMEEQSGQSQMMQLIPDQNYLRERADAMTTVESNIVELGTIFNKLAVMVNEHSEMVQRVEDNVDNANDNIMLSMNTLTDTLDNLRSNRQLFFRVLAVLVVFAILFITFFA